MNLGLHKSAQLGLSSKSKINSVVPSRVTNLSSTLLKIVDREKTSKMTSIQIIGHVVLLQLLYKMLPIQVGTTCSQPDGFMLDKSILQGELEL